MCQILVVAVADMTAVTLGLECGCGVTLAWEGLPRERGRKGRCGGGEVPMGRYRVVGTSVLTRYAEADTC